MSLNKFSRAVQQVNRTINSTGQATRNTKTLGRELSTLKPFKSKGAKQSQTVQEEQGWKCVCGTENQSKFCGNCGQKQAMCPDCDKPVTSKFCPDCGKAVDR